MAVVLYNAATFDADNIEKEQGKLNIIEFVEFYNQMYYYQTSRWVESKIENYLTQRTLSREELLQIFAWKTDRINMIKSQGEKRFCFRGKAKDNTGELKWVINKDKQTATSSTRRKIDSHELYKFLGVVKEQKEAYYDLKVKLNKDAEREKKLSEHKNEILKALTNKDVLTNKKVLPDNIGSVYLLTFFYFITQGDEPIYDYFAMKALDAIYPEGEILESLPLGFPAENRNTPLKSADLLTKCPVYQAYRDKLHDFMNEYNIAVGEYNKTLKDKNNMKKTVTSASREIDRALWVYGHFFQ